MPWISHDPKEHCSLAAHTQKGVTIFNGLPLMSRFSAGFFSGQIEGGRIQHASNTHPTGDQVSSIQVVAFGFTDLQSLLCSSASAFTVWLLGEFHGVMSGALLKGNPSDQWGIDSVCVGTCVLEIMFSWSLVYRSCISVQIAEIYHRVLSSIEGQLTWLAWMWRFLSCIEAGFLSRCAATCINPWDDWPFNEDYWMLK